MTHLPIITQETRVVNVSTVETTKLDDFVQRHERALAALEELNEVAKGWLRTAGAMTNRDDAELVEAAARSVLDLVREGLR